MHDTHNSASFIKICYDVINNTEALLVEADMATAILASSLSVKVRFFGHFYLIATYLPTLCTIKSVHANKHFNCNVFIGMSVLDHWLKPF